MQVFQTFSIYKTPCQNSWFKHQSTETPKKSRVDRKVVINGITEQYAKSKIVRDFLSAVWTILKGVIKRFLTIFTLVGRRHCKRFV
jgi:hypothetical protein